jgi:hypothetical protein
MRLLAQVLLLMVLYCCIEKCWNPIAMQHPQTMTLIMNNVFGVAYRTGAHEAVHSLDHYCLLHNSVPTTLLLQLQQNQFGRIDFAIYGCRITAQNAYRQRTSGTLHTVVN